MNLEFQKAIAKKRIISFSKGKQLIKKELADAKADLDEAEDRFKNKRFKYATITAYYSMFHCARGFIYSKGYREKSHYYLIVALGALFIDRGLLDKALLESFHDAMVLREDADYHGNFTEAGAASNIESAKLFLAKAREVLVMMR